MTGSVVDGEDVVQEALMKAIEAFPALVDHQPRRMALPHCPQCRTGLSAPRARQNSTHSRKDPDMIAADE